MIIRLQFLLLFLLLTFAASTAFGTDSKDDELKVRMERQVTSNCDSPNKKMICAFADDASKPTKFGAKSDKSSSKYVSIDISEDKQWVITLHGLTHENECNSIKLSNDVRFNCRSATIKELNIINSYFVFTITPEDSNELVPDLLKAYDKLEMSVTLNNKELPIEFPVIDEFENPCQTPVKSNSRPVSADDAKITQNNKQYTCEGNDNNKFLYVDRVKMDKSSILCSKRGWRKLDGTFIGDYKQDVYCLTPCGDDRINKDCNNDGDCEKAKYVSDEIICEHPTTHVLLIDDVRIDSGKVECAHEGWKTKGAFLKKGDKVYGHGDLRAGCYSKCHVKNLLLKESAKEKYANKRLICPDTSAVKYKYGATTGTILGDLQCDYSRGWNVIDTDRTLITFGSTLDTIELECIDICTDPFVEHGCTGNKGCKTPTWNQQRQMFTCADTEVMKIGTEYEYNGVKCDKKKFEHGSGKVVRRTDINTKLKATCISKCDKEFIKWTCETDECQTTTANVYQCASAMDYTELTKSGSASPLYSMGGFECDPKIGWSSTEHKEAMKFGDNSYKVEIKCTDACSDRFEGNCPDNSQYCVKPDYDAVNQKITCQDTHVMKWNDEEWDKEELVCKGRNKFTRTTKSATVFEFGVEFPKSKKTIQCISKCYTDFVTKTITSDMPSSLPKRSDNALSCESNEILRLDTKHFFAAAANCISDGWAEGNSRQASVKFADRYRMDATCLKVCDAQMIDQKDSTGIKHYYTGKTLECQEHHRLFVGDNEEETDPLTCDRMGWKKTTDQKLVIDFAQPQVDPTKKVKALCRHKCDKYFVKNSCTGSGCTKAIYQNKMLSCGHNSEILIIKYGSRQFESFFDLACTDGGWKADNVVVQEFTQNKYEIHARCEQLCDIGKLTGTASQDRKFLDDGQGNLVLTCSQDHLMLKFDNQEVYSDMLCTKEGWAKSFEKGTTVKQFVPNDQQNRGLAAECVTNPCIPGDPSHREEPCEEGQSSETCSKPDFKTVKYRMKCPGQMRIVRKSSERQEEGKTKYTDFESLMCFKGAWRQTETGKEVFPVNSADKKFDFKCFAGECANCKETLSLIGCKNENCAKPQFVPGTSYYCSHYKCTYAYKTEMGGKSKYFESGDNVKVECKDGGGDYLVPDGSSTLTNLGCVRQIPCTEHSPLDHSCPANATCFANLLATMQSDELAGAKSLPPTPSNPTKCAAPYVMYYIAGNNEYPKLEHIQCQKSGQWLAKFLDGSAPDTTLSINDGVFCSSNDPTLPKPKPPFDKEHPCNDCTPLRSLTMNCDECLTEDKLTMEADKGECIAKSPTGRFVIGNDKYTTEKIFCNEVTAPFWHTEGGRVSSIAARQATLEDKMNIWVIIGIVAGAVVLFSLVVGFIIFIVIRRKKEAKKQEALKNKGLEQKIDSIIDGVSVSETKTIRL